LNGLMQFTTDPRVAALRLRDGGLVAVPTETVYGLAARADDPHAVARIYDAKGRPADHPLIVHVADASALDHWAASIPDYARALADVFWPGPMTLVVKRSDRAGDFITGGQDSVAVRVSSHPLMDETLRALIQLTDDPSIGIAAPSANRFGRVSPTSAQHVHDEFANIIGDDDYILDGGESAVGVESTIVDCTDEIPRLLRAGAITVDDIERVTGIRPGMTSTVRASGTLESHYAPVADVVITDHEGLAASHVTYVARVGVLALASIETPVGMVRLSAPASNDEFAHVLYAALREADALQLTTVLAVLPDDSGLGAAVIDRLKRAAHS
jgi:L-threonylcarbamoyladenylate synthase